MGYYAAGGVGADALGWAYKKARKAVAGVPYGEEFNQAWDWASEKAMGYYNGGDVGQVAGLQRGGSGGYNAVPGSSAADYGYTPGGGGGGGGGGRAYRRTNPMNVRAARRAIRRLTSFARIAKTIYAFTHKKAGGGHFKLKRRRKSC